MKPLHLVGEQFDGRLDPFGRQGRLTEAVNLAMKLPAHRRGSAAGRRDDDDPVKRSSQASNNKTTANPAAIRINRC